MTDIRDEAARLQRYDLITNYRCGASIEEMERSDDGEWVRYEDVQAELARVTEERNEARKSYETMSANCKFNVQKRGEAEAERDRLRAQIGQLIAACADEGHAGTQQHCSICRTLAALSAAPPDQE